MIGIEFNSYFHHQSESSEQLEESFFSDCFAGKESDFFSYSPHSQEIESWKLLVKKYSHKKTFIHVGIGGSSLGPKTLIKSLLPREQSKNFHFLDNVDPDHIANLIEGIDPQTVLIYVVSKSGNTAETLSVFSFLCNWLKSYSIGQDDWRNIFVIASDNNDGDLRTIAKAYKLDTLTIPTKLGGRFSALSAVGLFPLIWGGGDYQKLLAGSEKFKLTAATNQPFLKLAKNLANSHNSRPITVLMPYSSRLNTFNSWFVQLWAESLGKKYDRDGKEVHIGLSPLGAIGATDQHSIVQLFAEGPLDKNILFIKIKNFAHNELIASELESPTLNKLQTITLGQLLNAEFQATYRSLDEKKVACCKIELENLQEESLGHLMMLFETLTALVGYHLNINPYDQPGVEDGKRYTYELVDQLRNENALVENNQPES